MSSANLWLQQEPPSISSLYGILFLLLYPLRPLYPFRQRWTGMERQRLSVKCPTSNCSKYRTILFNHLGNNLGFCVFIILCPYRWFQTCPGSSCMWWLLLASTSSSIMSINVVSRAPVHLLLYILYWVWLVFICFWSYPIYLNSLLLKVVVIIEL